LSPSINDLQQLRATTKANVDMATPSMDKHPSSPRTELDLITEQELDRLITRRKLGLATPKQVRVMRRYGHQRPELATFEEAKQFLDAQFANR